MQQFQYVFINLNMVKSIASFQTSIPHSLLQVRRTLQLSLSSHQHVCISKYQEDINGATEEHIDLKMPQLDQYLPYKPHSSFKPHEWYFVQKLKNMMLVLGPHRKDRNYSRDKANIGNPKVNRSCPPLTANSISADCVESTPEPSVQIFYCPSTIMGVSRFPKRNLKKTDHTRKLWLTEALTTQFRWKN